jgi:hypothetical protein
LLLGLIFIVSAKPKVHSEKLAKSLSQISALSSKNAIDEVLKLLA